MEWKRHTSHAPLRSLTAEQAEELFAKVDNSGHTNAREAENQRQRRKRLGHGVAVDPLSADDPSGSNVGTTISRASIILATFVVVAIVAVFAYSSNALSANTANLSNNVNVLTVAAALNDGVEWGNGFTQFPSDFSVKEADQNTGRIEVSVVDVTSPNALGCFSNAQIQAAALAVNSLLNPHIDTVIYHVNVRRDEQGNIQRSSLFGFLRPTGEVSPFMTFIWTKNTTSDGQVRFNCTITGVDEDLQDTLRKQIVSQTTNQELVEEVTTTYEQH
ncbi:MAG: hypothetical protein Q4A07_07230 [Coriobacteriales bacterium]|nr:hypothetical protein [Coriobacteriales bacterium]